MYQGDQGAQGAQGADGASGIGPSGSAVLLSSDTYVELPYDHTVVGDNPVVIVSIVEDGSNAPVPYFTSINSTTHMFRIYITAPVAYDITFIYELQPNL